MVAVFLVATAHAATITKFNSTTGMFDNSSGNRLFTITVGEAVGNITDVDIAIEFGKHDGESFGVDAGGIPYFNEIVFRLTNPQNTVTANLISAGDFNNGASPGFLGTITFDEAAANVVNVDPNRPQAGSFSTPGLTLNGFNGTPVVAGDWDLFIQDIVGQDALDFYSATLTITTDSVDVPEPGQVAAMAMVLLGIGGTLARRSLGRKKA